MVNSETCDTSIVSWGSGLEDLAEEEGEGDRLVVVVSSKAKATTAPEVDASPNTASAGPACPRGFRHYPKQKTGAMG